MKPECPQCERYKEAAFRDAIEFSKFRTMLQIAQDRIADATTKERERCAAIAEAMGCDAVAVEIRKGGE